MVHAEKVEHGGVEVVDLHLVFHGEIAEIIGGTVDDAGFYTTAGHPHGEAERVVVAADVGHVAVVGQLRAGCPAKFASPYDESLVQHSPCF